MIYKLIFEKTAAAESGLLYSARHLPGRPLLWLPAGCSNSKKGGAPIAGNRGRCRIVIFAGACQIALNLFLPSSTSSKGNHVARAQPRHILADRSDGGRAAFDGQAYCGSSPPFDPPQRETGAFHGRRPRLATSSRSRGPIESEVE
jgi:hypothetical protein